MSNVVKQTIEITQIANVSNVLDNINKIKGALKELAVPSDLQEGFDKAFSNAEKQVEKASKAMASGFKTKGSVEAYEQAMTQIVGIFDDLNKRIERLNNQKVVLKADVTPFKQLNEEIDKLNDDIKKAGKNIESLKELKRINNLGSGTGNRVESWEKLVKAYKDGNITAATNALKTLKGMLTKHEGDANYSKGTNWESFDKDYTFAVQKVKELSAAQDEYAKKIDLKNKKEAEAAQYTKKAANTYDQVKNATQQSSERIRVYAKDSAEAARSTQQLNSELERFKNKAAYFFGIANGINLFKRALRSAYATVKDLDAVMTETAVVTNFDVGDMWSQLPEYTQRANELGVTIHDTYEAATLFYQQGLKTNEVMQISNETLKMARIAGLDAATASDRMTNALRGFNMELDKTSAQRVNDVYSKLAAITASNTDEISTAMTKVASLAHNANMEFETTAAFLAQIIESTRESAETAGTALKTVVARFSEVKKLYSKGELMGQDEEGEEIDVNKVSTALRSAGINLNEYLTGAKGLDDIFIELAEKWDSLDQVQQRYIATMAAGSRQQSRFIALMSDYKRTAELVSAANNANGASQEQYSKTLESLQTKLARLKNAWNEFVLGLANSDAIKAAVDMLTNLITAINTLIKKVSGKNAGIKMIASFFTAFTAFKIGSKLTGNNNPIVNYFNALSKTAAKKVAASARVVAKEYGNSLTSAIKGEFNKKKNNFFNQFKFETISTNYKIESMDGLRKGIYKSDAWKNANPNQKIAVNTAIQTEDINKVNKALEQQGLQLQINEKNEKQFGVTSKSVTKTSVEGWQAISKAALVFGTVLIAVGDRLESLGGAFEVISPIIKGLGAGLLVFGTIMSVTIPMMAQLGAAGVTAAIESIPIIGWITAVISAVVALGAAIYNISKNNSISVKLEDAAHAAEDAAEAADEAKKAFNELNQAWDNLNDKYDTIKNATKGTKEWKNAVKELNNQVLELMNTYTNIKIERDDDGILHITNQDELSKEQEEKVYQTQGTARVANMLENKRSVQNKYKELTDWTGGATGLSRAADRLKYENKLKDVSFMSDKEITDYIAKGNQRAATVYRDPTVEKNIKLIRDYAKFYNEQQEHSNQEARAFGATVLEKTNVNDELKEYANSFLSDDYISKLTNEKLDNYDKFWKNPQKIYAKKKNYSNWNAYIDAHPEDKQATKSEILSRLATNDALEQATEQTRVFTSNIAKLNDENEKAFFEKPGGGALTQDQAYNLKDYTPKQIETLYNNLGGSKILNESLESFTTRFQTSVGEVVANFDLDTKYGAEFSRHVSSALTGNLDSETFKGFTENLWSIFTASGYDGMKEIQNSILKLDLKPEQQEALLKNLNKIDWTSSNSIRSLSDLVKEYDISEDAVNGLEEQIIKFNNAAKKVDLKKVTEQLKSALKIGKDINTGTQGRSFSEEQMNKLIEAGVSKDKFVYNIETGNYDYTGVLNDILTSINKLVDKTYDTKQLEKDVKSGQAAKDSLGDKTPIGPGEKATVIGNYVDKAGKNSKISPEMIEYAKNEALNNNNYDVIDKLFTIVNNEATNLQGKQKELEEDNFNKDVMAHQMNSASVNASNAMWGDKAARKALEGQVSSSGMSEQLKEKLLTGMTPGTMTDYITSIDWTKMAGNITDTFAQAKSFGVDSKELEAYANSLRQINGLENMRLDNLYQLALAETNYQKGQQSLYDSYDDWTKLIQKNGGIVPDGSIEQGKVFSKLKDDLKQMLNLTEDLPDDFLKAKENVDLLKKAVKGDKDAVEKLRTAAAKVQLNNIDIKDNLKKDITNKIDELSKKTPNLKIGATLDSTDAGKDLMEFVNKAGMSVEDIQKLFNSLGWAPDIKWKDLSYKEAQEIAQTGTVYQRNPDGSYEPVKLDGKENLDATQNFYIPQIGPKTSKVAPRPPKKTSKSGGKGKGKGGGGKKKSKAKKERWENPYDELYNLQEKINESLRKREALERRYQKLLKQEQSSLSDIRKSYYDQIKQIRTEANLQKELEAGRLRQINNIGKQTYVDSKGKVKTFDQMGVTKYAKYNKEIGTIEIDWEGIQALEGSKHVETGKAVEAYISKLEELVQSYEEVRDKLWELEDKIEEFREAAIDSYLSFEDRVMDDLVNHYQKEIDSYQAMSDAIDKVNNEVISSLREQIDLSRQIRDNTEKEEDISKKENRLAYLQRDTSGANDLEILSLQKELKDAREGYSDTLVDQAIDKMQKDADTASEQRQRQIEIMQAQLDIAKKTGALWKQVYTLMSDTAKSEIFSEDSELAKLLKDGEAFKALSNIGQKNWWAEVGKAFREAIIGRDEAEDKFKTDANNDGTIANTGTSDYLKEIGEMNTQANVTADTYDRTDEQNYGAAAAIVMGGKTHGGWGATSENWKNNLKEKGFDPGVVLDIVEAFNTQKKVWDAAEAATQKKKGKYKKGKSKGKWKYTVKPWDGWKTMGVTDWKKYQMSQFKTGGLADKTGPAWLDGTRSHPELVLNSQDTRNFIALKDILASLMNPQNKANTAAAGNVYLDIDINADIGSDYDVDRLASRIKKQIFDEGQYRNINTISFLR